MSVMTTVFIVDKYWPFYSIYVFIHEKDKVVLWRFLGAINWDSKGAHSLSVIVKSLYFAYLNSYGYFSKLPVINPIS